MDSSSFARAFFGDFKRTIEIPEAGAELVCQLFDRLGMVHVVVGTTDQDDH